MREIVDHLVFTFGGPNVFAQKLYQSCLDGSESHRRRVFETILAMDCALTKERAAEKQLLAAKLRSGGANANDVADALEQLSTKQLIDAACESVRVLARADLLGEALRRLRGKGELDGERLEEVRRAVA